MRAVVATLPDLTQVLSLDTVKKHLRVEVSDDDDLIQAYCEAAVASIDGPAGWLGRCIAVQEIDLYLDRFDPNAYTLPYGPVQSIEAVSYVDAGGNEATVADTIYQLQGDKLLPAFGQHWPSTAWRSEAVKVSYVAGYEDLPPAIKAALLLMVGDLYKNRATTIALSGAVLAVPMSTTVEALLGPFRVWSC